MRGNEWLYFIMVFIALVNGVVELIFKRIAVFEKQQLIKIVQLKLNFNISF